MSKTNRAYHNLINSTSFNAIRNKNVPMFDTSRFTDVTTNRQQRNGTAMYRDNANPGVYYSSHSSGYVRRSVRTSIKMVTPKRTSVYFNDQTYQINPRGSENSTIKINRGNQRLARIQEMADKFNKKRPTITAIHTRGDTSIIITPDV